MAAERVWTPEEAYRYCGELSRSHYENFTVGSLLLPREKRRHVYAIYAYCRWVDDLGDEYRQSAGGLPVGVDEASHRLALLDQWQRELETCYSGAPSHPVTVALRQTIRTFDIPPQPFLKLIDANRMDQWVSRYPTYDQLLHYCDHSANPVGHLFLYLFGYRDVQRQRLADATCTALQLTNFWQDVSRDKLKGRIYLPQEDMTRFGYPEGLLADGQVNDAFRQLMAFEVARTRTLFQEGMALLPLITGAARVDVRLFTRGGLAVLDAIQAQGYNVLAKRPVLSRWRKAAIFLSSLLAVKLASLRGG
ncbi:MAG: squalene synthase HpnC [SAR202 cluster bacterium]|nr:squalene synthase HpnC [SAR202 cluster bacterium]